MTIPYKDLFSNQAEEYRLYRPSYPDALFSHISALAPGREAAWDCATGNGQSAVLLAKHFRHVCATDASADQIAHAIRHPNVRYQVSSAHATGLKEHSIDLVTVAQAIHWFDNEAFYHEVERVLKPGGVIAAWSYRLPKISPEVDRIIHTLFDDILADYWENEIQLARQEYRTLLFPFEELPSPEFSFTTIWSFPRLIGYLLTWSGVATCRRKKGIDPVDGITQNLLDAWGERSTEKEVRWEIFLRSGRIPFE